MESREKLFFNKLKESRGHYYVEYQPPHSNDLFATMSMTYPDAHDPASVAKDMQGEMNEWLTRYLVPIMLSAHDATQSIILLDGVGNDGFLVGWIDPASKSIVTSWDFKELTRIIEASITLPDLKAVYHDIPFRTEAQVKTEGQQWVNQRRNQNRLLKWLLILWLAVFPAAWAIFECAGPQWVGFMVLAYSLWKAIQTWRQLTGRRKPSKSEQEKAEKDRIMAHHHYHCERNPIGFNRLKLENFERESKERTRKEAQELAAIKAEAA